MQECANSEVSKAFDGVNGSKELFDGVQSGAAPNPAANPPLACKICIVLLLGFYGP